MRPSMKELQVKAEDLFRAACELRGYVVQKLPIYKDAKTPDFRVSLGGGEFVAEVKSPGFEQAIQEWMVDPSRILYSKPGKHVRGLLKDAQAQLAAHNSGSPKIAVICDMRPFFPGYPMYPLYGFSHHDLAAGMFGETQFVYGLQPNGGVAFQDAQLGGNRTLRSDQYTHVSAVVLHLVHADCQPGRFQVFHNPFAARAFPTTWFRGPDDQHFRLAEEEAGFVLTWVEQK